MRPNLLIIFLVFITGRVFAADLSEFLGRFEAQNQPCIGNLDNLLEFEIYSPDSTSLQGKVTKTLPGRDYGMGYIFINFENINSGIQNYQLDDDDGGCEIGTVLTSLNGMEIRTETNGKYHPICGRSFGARKYQRTKSLILNYQGSSVEMIYSVTDERNSRSCLLKRL